MAVHDRRRPAPGPGRERAGAGASSERERTSSTATELEAATRRRRVGAGAGAAAGADAALRARAPLRRATGRTVARVGSRGVGAGATARDGGSRTCAAPRASGRVATRLRRRGARRSCDASRGRPCAGAGAAACPCEAVARTTRRSPGRRVHGRAAAGRRGGRHRRRPSTRARPARVRAVRGSRNRRRRRLAAAAASAGAGVSGRSALRPARTAPRQPALTGRPRRAGAAGAGGGDVRCGARRQERQRVEVALRLGGDAHAEVDVRRRDLRLAGGADRGDGVALGDRGALRDVDRAEVGQRDGEAVGGLDREARARCGHGAGERDDARRGRAHVGARVAADVDAPVLAGGVRVRRVEDERLEDRPVDRPRPRRRGAA